MKILVVLNQDGGTLKTTDLDWLSGLLKDEFTVQGHEIEVSRCKGEAVVQSIKDAVARADTDVLVVAGGDGTVSAAAATCAGTRTALGILPAGTMNLFARTLQVPLDLEPAIQALASGTLTKVDVARVNGEVFVHQYAVGLHARMVRMRKKFSYGSRIGKVVATWRAGWMAIRSHPSVKLTIDLDGESQTIKSAAVAFSNNFYGNGHIPFADDPTEGVLGVYICKADTVGRMSKLILDILMGTWRQNPHLVTQKARRVKIVYEGRHQDNRAVKDGELERLERETVIEIEPGALNVLVPSQATYLKRVPRPGEVLPA
ncbi:diacylglycerol kinase family protein [Fulvimarina sp. 2208YS6-2-32]|uniref:Diacylglycerol kinase family protein n=1 Tax=Fulvimarina uroteuthidis TaxID=3098149 RepID=A0ABU5HWY4_9HYPH|nr:diacylglycerol kinase family protein [Fulvimarina sp. 2208YS6-2-32]MDY8107657.1 diacylglycerol kinase family protein [Fulvimarina sp. 2208YS6-2-32]